MKMKAETTTSMPSSRTGHGQRPDLLVAERAAVEPDVVDGTVQVSRPIVRVRRPADDEIGVGSVALARTRRCGLASIEPHGDGVSGGHGGEVVPPVVADDEGVAGDGPR